MSNRIAVIGSGISGIAAAWLLSRTHDVTLIEKAPRLGGHTNTVLAATADGPIPVDTGFIVYNRRNYPNLTALLDYLGVATAPTSMSFALSAQRGQLEYCGRHLNGLFGQRRNIVRLRHWQLVSDILRFFRQATIQSQAIDDEVTIGEFLRQFGYSDVFIEDHILPVSSAIWSTPARSMLEFPAKAFITFFSNHGLLQINDRPQWRTMVGGARHYIDRMLEDGRFRVLTSAHIETVRRQPDGVDVCFSTGDRRHFDQVVFACHPDQALRLLAAPSPAERNLLSAFRYTPNRAVLHTDDRFMPRRRRLWSSWNYLRTGVGPSADLSLTYWMNALQPLATRTNLFVTLNPMHEFAPGAVQKIIDYEHPLFNAQAIAAQRDIWQIQGTQRTWFAGAWLGYGFHEDGLQSGLEIAERLGSCNRPWQVTEARSRIAHNWLAAEQARAAAE